MASSSLEAIIYSTDVLATTISGFLEAIAVQKYNCARLVGQYEKEKASEAFEQLAAAFERLADTIRQMGRAMDLPDVTTMKM